jgi:hypothetical protein
MQSLPSTIMVFTGRIEWTSGRPGPWRLLVPVAAFLLLSGCQKNGGEKDTTTDGMPDTGDPAGDRDVPVGDADSTDGDADIPGDEGTAQDDVEPPDGPTVTVTPAEIDDLLTNPGMGFAITTLWGAPPIEEHPATSVAYFRWPWARMEPTEGGYDFEYLDGIIEEARSQGMSIAFRFMSEYDTGSPRWLLDKGIDSVAVEGGTFPDYNNPIFMDYLERLIRAFGERYAGSLDVDHVDIGSVGCWGEWNTACCPADVLATCEQYYPTEANQQAIIDMYFTYFPGTPLVMLVGGLLDYAVERGAGWRGDCFGDYREGWNHMETIYSETAEDPVTGIAWQTAPVQFESCWVMQTWHDNGWDIDLILQKGLDWHVSVFNNKSDPVPADWRARVDEWLKHVGYRMVLRQLTHTAEAGPGGAILLQSQWENVGVAPMYHPWPLAYRLRSSSDEAVARWTSPADLRQWLPGAHSVEDVVNVPEGIAAGLYSLDVAILTEDAAAPHVDLAIAGRRSDRWYPVSQVTIIE